MGRIWGLVAALVGSLACDPLVGPFSTEYVVGPCGLRRHTLVIDGQKALVLTPPDLEPDTPAPLVLYHHGVGEDWQTIERSNSRRPTICALGAAGYIIAGSDAHGENWGKPQAIDDYAKLYLAIAAERPISDVMLLSMSMGGLSGLLTLGYRAVPDVRAWVGISPVTNLGYSYFDHEDFPRRIARAYSGTPSTLQDPMSLDPAAFAGVPMLAWASYDDARVPRAQNIDAFLAHIGDPPTARVITSRGNHGDPSHQDPAAVVAFFDDHRSD